MYLLLFHELRIWYIVNHVFAEHWSRQDRVDLFSVDVFQLGIEDELIPLGAEIYGDLTAEEDEGKHIAILGMGYLVSF